MQYSTRAVSHVTSKNRRTKPIRAIALANESTMFTEVLKYNSNLLFRVVVSWQKICEKKKNVVLQAILQAIQLKGCYHSEYNVKRKVDQRKIVKQKNIPDGPLKSRN